jgi:hypothetical protein
MVRSIGCGPTSGETISQKGQGPSIGPWTIISIGYLGMSHGRTAGAAHSLTSLAGIPSSWRDNEGLKQSTLRFNSRRVMGLRATKVPDS